MENDQTLFLIGQTVLFDMVTDNGKGLGEGGDKKDGNSN